MVTLKEAVEMLLACKKAQTESAVSRAGDYDLSTTITALNKVAAAAADREAVRIALGQARDATE